MNNVILIGRTTRDVELRFVPNSGTAVARFSMAVDREYSKDKEVDFFNIVVWGKTAEACGNYLKKGKRVAVRGAMRNNNYEDKQGVKHYNIEVNADKVEFLEWSNDQGQQQQNQQPSQQRSQDNFNGFQEIDDESGECPF